MLLHGEHRLSRLPLEQEQETGLGDLRDRIHVLAAATNPNQVRRSREVVVPEIVMDRLEVPRSASGLRIESDDGVREEVLPESVAAVVVGSGGADG